MLLPTEINNTLISTRVLEGSSFILKFISVRSFKGRLGSKEHWYEAQKCLPTSLTLPFSPLQSDVIRMLR